MNMKVKKLLSLLSAAAMAVTSLTGALTITASAADDIFDYSKFDSTGVLYLQSDYMLKNQKDIVIPNEHNGVPVNKVNLIKSASFSNHDNDNVTETLSYGVNIKDTSSCGGASAYRYELSRFKALKTVSYLYSGMDFTLQSNLAYKNDTNYSDSIEDIYIYAQGIAKIGGAQVFRKMNSNLKIHVTSETIADQIYDICKDGEYSLRRDQFIADLGNELPTAKVTVECADIDYGTEGGFKPTAKVTVDEKPVEDAKVTIKMFTDAGCVDEYGAPYTSSNISVGTYYFRASVEGTDTYMGAMSAPLEVHVREVVIDKTKLNEAIEAANSFKKSAIEEDYDAAAWHAVFGLNEAFDKAKRIADQTSNLTQATVEAATTTLNEALEKLKNSPADATAEWAELEKAISTAEALDKSEYTEDSYSKLESALKKAQALSKETATKTEIKGVLKELNNAIEGLVIDQVVTPAGDPFAYVRYNYTATPFYKGTTDESMVGATRIRLTFDCAEDTSFNKYFTTNYSVDVGGIKSDSEVRGVGEENLGEKGCSAVLNLTSPIESGKSYSIIGYTYGYSNAKDYIFAITKIEFLDDTGHILKTITDATVAKEQLDAAIAKAGAVDAAAYTAESYAELTKAVDAAKALTDKATVAEITAAKDAIEAAIKALVPIEVPVLGAIEGTIKTPGADAEVTVTVATADGETVAEVTAANGEYSISDLEDGEYIVTFAADGYAARSYTAAVAGGSVTLEAEIHLYGDVNGDGEITTADVGMANSHAREVSALEGYDFDVAEVTGDGEVTTADVGVINATAQKI